MGVSTLTANVWRTRLHSVTFISIFVHFLKLFLVHLVLHLYSVLWLPELSLLCSLFCYAALQFGERWREDDSQQWTCPYMSTYGFGGHSGSYQTCSDFQPLKNCIPKFWFLQQNHLSDMHLRNSEYFNYSLITSCTSSYIEEEKCAVRRRLWCKKLLSDNELQRFDTVSEKLTVRNSQD